MTCYIKIIKFKLFYFFDCFSEYLHNLIWYKYIYISLKSYIYLFIFFKLIRVYFFNNKLNKNLLYIL